MNLKLNGTDPKLVVAIGASAGGLNACKQFFSEMPTNTNMAFVVIMHLDPNHESHLAEILQSVTKMKVVQVSKNLNKTKINNNCIYVIAPNTLLTIRKGKLNVLKTPRSNKDCGAIDTLFISLAKDKKQKAVGLIFSGSGSDGTLGVQKIKEYGGLCLAQDPLTAGSTAMPENAILSGAIDKSLNIEDMPKIILSYSQNYNVSSILEVEDQKQKMYSPEINDILELLSSAHQVDFSNSYKRGTLIRRIQRRMDLKGNSNSKEYLQLLKSDDAEMEALYGDMLIGVTHFFRNLEAWEQLQQKIIPALLKQTNKKPLIKIWVAGCASGEEAYSLAIVFIEKFNELKKPFELQIFATDISEKAIRTARKGVYPASISESISDERLSGFFEKQGDSIKVKQIVRDKVTFSVHNLLEDPAFSNLDLISCHNVLIYLDSSAQQKVLEKFHFALKPGGYLLLGPSETVGRCGSLFETVSQKHHSYKALLMASNNRYNYLSWTSKRTPANFASKRLAVNHHSLTGPNTNQMIEKYVLTNYTRACVVISASFEIQSFFGPITDYLLQPTGEIHMSLFSWVRPGMYPNLKTAVNEAIKNNKSVKTSELYVERDNNIVRVECKIEPITHLNKDLRLFLISFKDQSDTKPKVKSQTHLAPHDSVTRQLETELNITRNELQRTFEQLEFTNEEYKASHEELLSLNEELQSSNEELEATKEELQSLNEELVTVNQELQDKNQKSLQLSSDLKNLLVSSDIPIILLDQKLRVRQFTPASTELMYLVDADIGRSINDIKMRFKTDYDIHSDLNKVLNGQAPISSFMQTENGLFYNCHILPYRTQDNHTEGVCITFQNISELTKAKKKSDEARKFSEAIIETVQTALLVLSPDFRVVDANASFYKLFRTTEANTVGRLLFDLGNQHWNIPQLRSLLKEVLPREIEVNNFEVKHEFPNLGHCVMSLNARQLRSSDSPLILLSIELISSRKLTDLLIKKHREEMLAEHKRKDEFLAMLGHELRNPISAISHGLNYLENPKSDWSKFEKTRLMMSRQANRVANLLDQLLDVARIISGNVQLTKSTVDLVEAVQAGAEGVKPLIEAKQHKLHLALPPTKTLFVKGDFSRLAQVTENLMNNAAKYTKNNGNIWLSLKAKDGSAILSVRDDGVGIEKELIPHLFESFTQAPRNLGRVEGGLGLGLSLVKLIVKEHNGLVEVKSLGQGMGSEFIVTLPIIEMDHESIASPKTSDKIKLPKSEAIQSRKILIVEDERDLSDIFKIVLEDLGHKIEVAYDGTTALKVANNFQPEIVILDIGLPEIDGYKLASLLRKKYEGKKLLIIALTGYKKNIEMLDQAGIDHHLIKPPDLKKLYQWINNYGNNSNNSEK